MVEKNFVRKKVRSLTLGEKLRQLREDRTLSVKSLSRKINVKVAYIVALEKGEYGNLPTKVYAKGFVRSYARFFGVPEEILLRLFEKEYSIYRNISDKDVEETVNRLPKVPRFVFTPRVLFVLCSMIVLCCIGVYLYFGVDNFVSSPWLVVEEPLNDSVVHSHVVTVTGKTRSNAKVLINGQQVFVDIDGRFSDDVGLSPGINVINVSSINKFDKKSMYEVTVDAQFHVEKPQADDAEKNIVVFIKAQNKPVWISVDADHVGVYDDVIMVGEEKTFNASAHISVTTSSGRNTLVSHDGTQYKEMSKDDEVVKGWVYEGEESEEEKKEDRVVE